MADTGVSFFPVMGESLNQQNTVLLDLGPENKALNQINLMDNQSFHDFIFGYLKDKDHRFAIGGYAENRIIYTRSKVFATTTASFRNIHLGIDVWAEAGIPIYSPLDGRVHSFKDNVGFGNYGPTVILEHQLHNQVIYSLYGHLSRKDLNNLRPGLAVKRGQKIGHLGAPNENGDWPPHLHFQLVKNLENFEGDYPGVCSENEKLKYLENCPNPMQWIGSSLIG